MEKKLVVGKLLYRRHVCRNEEERSFMAIIRQLNFLLE